jgi:hypothetical protein
LARACAAANAARGCPGAVGGCVHLVRRCRHCCGSLADLVECCLGLDFDGFGHLDQGCLFVLGR